MVSNESNQLFNQIAIKKPPMKRTTHLMTEDDIDSSQNEPSPRAKEYQSVPLRPPSIKNLDKPESVERSDNKRDF